MIKTKLLFLLFIIGLMLAFSACSKSNKIFPTSSTTSSLETSTAENDKTVQYHFSVVHSEKGDSQKYVIPNQADAADRGIYTNKIYYEDLELIGNRVYVPGSTRTAIYKYTTGSIKNSGTSDLGDFYCIYDYYLGTGGEMIEYLHGTNILAFYSATTNQNIIVQSVDEAKARKIAEDFIVTAIGAERFQKLTFVRINTDVVGRYAITYKRYLDGYETDETIAIFVDKNGNISGYNGYNIGKYDAVPHLPTKAEIDAAYKILDDTVHSLGLSNLQINPPSLITNTVGEVFLEMRFKYTTSSGTTEDTWGDAIIINID